MIQAFVDVFSLPSYTSTSSVNRPGSPSKVTSSPNRYLNHYNINYL